MMIESQHDYIDYRLQKTYESYADAELLAKNGIIDKRFGKHFTKLFDLRQKGDYGDLYDFDEVIPEPLILMTKKFIEEIKHHIES